MEASPVGGRLTHYAVALGLSGTDAFPLLFEEELESTFT